LKKRVLIVKILVILVLLMSFFCSYRSGTYTNTLKWPGWWEVVQEEYYAERLTEHDMSVVEACAQRLSITPDRVILTLLYHPTVPNSSHWETCEEPERFSRIEAIQSTFRLHSGVAYRLTHRGRSNFWQYIVSQGMNSSDVNITLFERLSPPNKVLARSQR